MIRKKKISAYFEMTKPRITVLILVTATLGYYLGGRGFQSPLTLFFLLIGSASVCGGSSVINHYLEREFDSKMQRTKNRPIPSGLISPVSALNFGIILTLVGIVILYVGTNILTAFLGLLTAFLYIMVYTPLKRISWLNTTIGAVPGAIPPLGGWAAATGHLEFGAGILFLILFLWQHPHFYAIAWMFKEDYKRGGFQMLPCIEEDGRRTFAQILWFSIFLVPISLIPTFIGMSGLVYFFGILLMGCGLVYLSHQLSLSKSFLDAKKLLRATIVYFPILLFLIVIDAKF